MSWKVILSLFAKTYFSRLKNRLFTTGSSRRNNKRISGVGRRRKRVYRANEQLIRGANRVELVHLHDRLANLLGGKCAVEFSPNFNFVLYGVSSYPIYIKGIDHV